MEISGETRAVDFDLLLFRFAFGTEDKRVPGLQIGQGRFDMRNQFEFALDDAAAKRGDRGEVFLIEFALDEGPKRLLETTGVDARTVPVGDNIHPLEIFEDGV